MAEIETRDQDIGRSAEPNIEDEAASHAFFEVLVVNGSGVVESKEGGLLDREERAHINPVHSLKSKGAHGFRLQSSRGVEEI